MLINVDLEFSANYYPEYFDERKGMKTAQTYETF